MTVYIKKISPTDKRFSNRSIEIYSAEGLDSIPIPDTVVLCNGCNQNIHAEDGEPEGEGYLVYLGKRELNADQPYDIYCEACVKDYFPKAVLVD